MDPLSEYVLSKWECKLSADKNIMIIHKDSTSLHCIKNLLWHENLHVCKKLNLVFIQVYQKINMLRSNICWIIYKQGQFKAVPNNHVNGFWMKGQEGMDFFNWGSVIMDYGYILPETTV